MECFFLITFLKFRDHGLDVVPPAGSFVSFPGGVENIHSVSESSQVQPKGVRLNQVMPSSSTSPQHDTANNNKGDGKHSLPVYDIPVADIPVADSSDRGPTVFLSKVPI